MSLRYIFGRPGSGKTTFCINEMIKADNQRLGDNLIYIVPEQFTLQSEKELINTSPEKALMNIQVLSFQRLSYHVFNETGGNEKKTLEDIGKSMLIRKVVNELKGELVFFSKVADKQGFIDQIFNIITEFSRYGISAERLNEVNKLIENNETLKLKMADLCKIAEKYRNFQLENYILSDERLDILAEKIDSSSLISNSIIWIDGFNGFTPQEYRIIEKLLINSKQVSIALPIDYAKASESVSVKLDYYYEIRSAIHEINTIACNNNIADDDCIRLDNNYRFGDNAELRRLQDNYLSSLPERFSNKVERININSSDNLYEEIENAAAEIRKLIIEKNMRFNEIGILAPMSDGYDKFIKNVFQKHSIPVFIDIRTDIMSHPLIEMIRSAFSVISDNWSYESVFRFLKTNLTPLNKNDVDIMENYVLLYGIKGGKWKKEWEYGFNINYETFERQKINELRENIINSLALLTDKFKANKKYPVKAISASLFMFLESLNVSDKINSWSEKEMECGNIRLAREHHQVWDKFIYVIDKAVEILGEECVSIEEYSKILDSGFSKSDLSVIPPSLDQVVVGDLRRSRMPEIKALFVLSANEGILPSRLQEPGLISEEERSYLTTEHRIKLMPAGNVKAYTEEFLIYSMLSKPGQLLYLSYYRGGLDGKTSLPSPVIKKIKHIFPELKVKKTDMSNSIASPHFGYNSFLTNFDSFVENGSIPAPYKDIYSYLATDDKYKDKIENIINISLDYKTEIYLKAETLAKLYGDVIKSSVSRLEKYIKCPFSYFMQYNLKAAERKLYEMENVDLGNLFHEVLDSFSKRIVNEDINWREADYNLIYDIASDCIDKELMEDTNEIFRNSRQYEFFAARAKEIAMRSISVIIEHMKNGDFDFTFSEASFKDTSDGSLGAIKIDLDNNTILHLEGKIDRVDLLSLEGSQYVKIIDYKSGNKTFSYPEIFYGLQLQLIIYLDAFIKKYREKYNNGKNIDILPAAVLYFRIDNPMINYSDISQKDNIETALFKKFKMSGLVLDEIDIIQKIDNSFESKSNIIPVAIKSSAAYKKLPVNQRPLTDTSSVISNNDFGKLMKFSKDKTEETAKKILSGDISVKPFKYNNTTGCGYCPYKAACKFDPVLDSANYNIMKSMKAKEAIEKILEKY